MKKLIYLMLIVLMISMVVPVHAQQTQQFNKIFLDPFYRIEMLLSTPYTYDVTVNPPDRIDTVVSAIVTFQIWLNPTIEFFLTVDGQTCNTASYEVHTTYAGAGEGTIFFDCSNIINGPGDYEIILTPDDDTGAVTGWLDLTYMNDPLGEADVFGTEYAPGDPGTIFLQLSDNQGTPINNATCHMDVYAPNSPNMTHPIFIDQTPLIYLDTSDALYYYDLIIPEGLGIYMLSATCAYDTSGFWVYDPLGVQSPDRTDISGTYVGSTLALNTRADSIYEQCISTTGGGTKLCYANYTFDVSPYDLTNITGIDLYYAGEATTSSASNDFLVFNFTSGTFIPLPNSLDFAGTASSSGPSNVNQFQGNSLPITDIVSGSDEIIIQLRGESGSSYTQYNNWLAIRIFTATGTISELKGSGELNVEDRLRNQTGIIQDVGTQVWTHPERNLTFYEDVTNYTLVADSVWQYNGTIIGNILDQIANAIWNFADRNITSFEFDVVNETEVADAVWTRTDRNLTFYEDFGDQTNYTLINELIEASANNITPEDIWNYADRNLTFYPEQLDLTNYTLIQEVVWTFGNRTLTSFPFNVNASVLNEVNATVADVFVGGTEYTQNDNAKIALRLIKAQGGGGASPELGAICNATVLYPNNTAFLNQSGMTELGEGVYTIDFTTPTTDGVYPYFIDCTAGGRSYFSLDTLHVSTLNTSSIVDDVWSATDRNLTFYEDVTDYDLIQEMVWNATVRSLTEFNFTVDVNTSAIADAVWSSVNRTLTETEDVTNYTLIAELINVTLVDLTNYSLIADLVNGSQIDLTNYTLVQELITNYGNELTAADIWSFSNRSLTDFPFTVNATVDFGDLNLTELAESVWMYEGNISNNIVTTLGDYTACVIESLFNPNDGWGVQITECLTN